MNKIKAFSCMLFCSFALFSCIEDKPVATLKADNLNAKVYVINFNETAVNLEIDGMPTEVSKSEKVYADFEKSLEAYSETNDVAVKKVFYYINHDGVEDDFPFASLDSEACFDAVDKKGKGMSLKLNGKNLLTTTVQKDFSKSFEIPSYADHFGYDVSEKNWKSNQLLLEYDEDASVKILVDWERIESNLTNPKYVILVPPTN